MSHQLRAGLMMGLSITYGFIVGRFHPPYFAFYAGIPLGAVCSVLWPIANRSHPPEL